MKDRNVLLSFTWRLELIKRTILPPHQLIQQSPRVKDPKGLLLLSPWSNNIKWNNIWCRYSFNFFLQNKIRELKIFLCINEVGRKLKRGMATSGMRTQNWIQIRAALQLRAALCPSLRKDQAALTLRTFLRTVRLKKRTLTRSDSPELTAAEPAQSHSKAGCSSAQPEPTRAWRYRHPQMIPASPLQGSDSGGQSDRAEGDRREPEGVDCASKL